jgi:N4-gp56 family major capsid protein
MPTAASVISSGVADYPAIYYDRVGDQSLRNNLFFYPALDLKQMPDRAGVAMQIFNYTAFGANTTPATEGTPSTGQALTQVIATINLSQYVDYISFSDKVVLTTISDIVAEGASELGYRGALSVDTVIKSAVDTAAGVDTNAKIEIATGTKYSTALFRRAAMQLRASNVHPKANGAFFGIIGSLAAYDIINDSAAGGFYDMMKYTDANASKLQEGIASSCRIGNVAGVELFESNNITTHAAWQGGANIAYDSYVFGKGAFFGASLGKTKIGNKNFAVKVGRFDGTNSLDPAGLIAAAAFYNFFFGVVKRPNSANVPAYRRITCEATIG